MVGIFLIVKSTRSIRTVRVEFLNKVEVVVVIDVDFVADVVVVVAK